ncbi:hypothetical protein A3Q56_05875 [Intoshia linei]|uniref:14-3-3 domain-containing protein n=1 Tax=Intoshia linei TaxID=1819745 RepID=A0A177AYE1_9BILA|nr:hypothetical protein A3Q56_05875 [Intoshia linei]
MTSIDPELNLVSEKTETKLMNEKEVFVFTAKLAEQAERYRDMANCMNQAAKFDYNLKQEERNLLSVAFKNLIGPHRAAYRVLTGHDKQTEQSHYRHIVQDKVAAVVVDIKLITNDVLTTLDEIIKVEDKPESIVFYKKMKGDYYRYHAEVTEGEERQKISDLAEAAYTEATELAQNEMKSTNPIRLGLALNFSVFYYEIKNNPTEACRIAKQAFDDAIIQLDGLPECSYNDSKLIMQLLRDNLTLWTNSNEADCDESVEQSGEPDNKDDSEQ